MIKGRILKDGYFHWYNGRQRATDKEVKNHLKANINLKSDAGTGDYISPQDRKTIGRIEGGIKRAATAKRDNGEYVPAKIERALKRMGVDLPVMLEKLSAATGEKITSLRQMRKEVPDAATALNDLLIGAGMPNFFTPEAAINVVKDFEGKRIILNGVEVSKNVAKAAISKTKSEIARKFNIVNQSMKVTFKGNDSIIINLPDLSQMEPDDDGEYSLSDFADMFGDDYELYGS